MCFLSMELLTGKATVVEEGNKSFIKSQRLTINSLHDQTFIFICLMSRHRYTSSYFIIYFIFVLSCFVFSFEYVHITQLHFTSVIRKIKTSQNDCYSGPALIHIYHFHVITVLNNAYCKLTKVCDVL